MATRRRCVTRSRIATRSSKTKQPERDHDNQEQATTASQTSTIRNTSLLLMMSSPEPCSPSQVKKSYEAEVERIGEEEDDDDSNGCWSTPKAKRFRIPEIENCPPAPKKQRTTASDDAGNYCMMRRSSIPFFTPHDQLDEFFFRASTVPNMSTA